MEYIPLIDEFIRFGDMESLWSLVDKLSWEGKAYSIIPHLLRMSGFESERYLPITVNVVDKTLLDIAGVILDNEGDYQSLALDSISNGGILLFSFIWTKYGDNLDIAELLNEADVVGDREIIDFIEEESYEME
jgi:hypothetical protein